MAANRPRGAAEWSATAPSDTSERKPFWTPVWPPRQVSGGRNAGYPLAPSGLHELVGILGAMRNQLDRPGGAVGARVWTRQGDRPSHGHGLEFNTKKG